MKLNGYRASHRNKWFLITQGILTLNEFLLFEYYLDLMDFDKRHDVKFALFEAFFEDVALVFKRGKDAVKIWHDGLVAKGFIKIIDEKRKLYTVKNPLRYVVGLTQWSGEASKYTKEEKNQTQEFILENVRFFQPESEKILSKIDELALKPSISTKDSLSSSKDNSIVSSSIGFHKVVVIKQEPRSDAEYIQIQNETTDDLRLSIEDMKWIDKNAIGRITIESDEHEKEVVRIYFENDFNKYQKNLLTN